MDPAMFLPFSPPNGLPQESKLVTYMNHSPQIQQLTHPMENMTLQAAAAAAPKKMIPEFMPAMYYIERPVVPPSPEHQSPPSMPSTSSNHQIHQRSVGGTTYFYPATPEELAAQGILNSSTMEHFPGVVVPPNMAPATPYQARYEMYLNPRPDFQENYYPENQSIVSELNSRSDLYLEHSINSYPNLPERVDDYAELVPLEAQNGLAITYRVTQMCTGKHFVMRRLPSFTTNYPVRSIEIWKSLWHPNVVRLCDLFTTRDFNDHSMVFLYEYHPGSETLYAKYLANSSTMNGMDHSRTYDPFSSDPNAPRPYTHQKNAMLRAVASGSLLPEHILWNVLIQLTAALKAIHNAGLTCRNLDATKVIMTGNRVRISFCGMTEVISPSSANNTPTEVAKQEDLIALGRLALSLACRSVHACHPDHLLNSMKKISKIYSYDVKNFILHLMTGSRNRSVNNLMPMIGVRFYNQLDSLQQRIDVIEEQLAKELDNGRLLQLLFKLGVIIERPELNMDPEWSETGDRYMLKLFRDYLFHTVTPDGRPWLDHAHMIHCLNQLDAGTDNCVQLTSRDGQSILVVKYSELKLYLNRSFADLTESFQSATPPS